MLIFNPRQMVLVSCRGRASVVGKVSEKHDILPCSWHSPLSSHPPLYGISIKSDLLAVSIIRDSGCFVVNFVPFSLADIIKKVMSTSGDFIEKCSTVGLTESQCDKVDCFHFKESLGWLECEVVEEHIIGDNVLFVGKVLFSNLDHNDKRPFIVEGDEFTTTL